MIEKIDECLRQIEQQHDVRIIYACESGSRAWGFESYDSDYDVRFIYAHQKSWYLSFDVEHKRDTIESFSNNRVIDLSGWDIKKACKLLMKSNPSLVEWLHSPIVYFYSGFSGEMKNLAFYANMRGLAYHYSHIATGHDYRYLRLFLDSGWPVNAKKLLYLLRSLLCVRFIEAYSSIPPIVLDNLVSLTCPHDLIDEVRSILKRKRSDVHEKGSRVKISLELKGWIRQELERIKEGLNHIPSTREMRDHYDEVNHLYRSIIGGTG